MNQVCVCAVTLFRNSECVCVCVCVVRDMAIVSSVFCAWCPSLTPPPHTRVPPAITRRPLRVVFLLRFQLNESARVSRCELWGRFSLLSVVDFEGKI